MKRLNFLLIATTIASIMFAKTPALTLHKAFMVCIPDGVAKTDGTEPWTSTWIPMTAEKTSNTVHEMTAFFQLAFNDE
jgi:Tfp pilus assembly protein FimT